MVSTLNNARIKFLSVTNNFIRNLEPCPLEKGHIHWIQIQLKINEMKIDVESIENILVIMVLKKK
jgi:hypothetical protein